jgi:hypothetical protein
MPETTTPNYDLPNWVRFSSFVCVVCPFPRLLASRMASFVIWSVYHFLVTPSRGYKSQSHKLMSPGNQKHRSHRILSNWHLDEPFAESYSCLLSSRLSFFSLCLFVCFFLSVLLFLFVSLEYILQPFLCTSFVSFVFFFFFFFSYVGCPYFHTYFIFCPFVSSSLVVFLRTVFFFLYFIRLCCILNFLFPNCFLFRLFLFTGVFIFRSVISSFVVFLHTIFSFLTVYSPPSFFMWRNVW